MILLIWKNAGVPIWHSDKVVHAIGILDIGLIQHDENMKPQHRWPKVDVRIGKDVVHAVEKMQGDRTAQTTDVPTSSSQATS